MSKARDVSRLFSKTGSSASDVGSSTVSSDTPPAGAGAGDKWFNTTNLTTYIYYDDGTSLQWVPAAAPIPGPTGPAGSPNFSAINQAMIPDTDVTHDLGSSTHKWKDLYLSGSTLHLGASATISAGTGSEIVLPSIKIGAGANAVKLSANASGGLETQAVVGGTTQAVKPAGGTVQVADLAAMQAIANPTIGDFVSVVSNKTIYMYNGTGFYKIAVMVNESPTAISGVDGSYVLETDGTATTITAISSDPEGRPLTWSYAVSSGALNGTTVAQTNNVFTITPHASNVAAFSLTFSVTDSINGVVNAVSTFGLSFIVTNSKYTALSLKATGTGSNQTFDDASASNLTISTTGNSSASTFSPYRHGGYSLGLDGTNDYITIPQTTDTDLTGDFTVECWVYFNDTAGANGFIGKWSPGAMGWTLYYSGDFTFYTSQNGSSLVSLSFTFGAATVGQWYHLAVSRTGSTISTYVNGTRTNTSTDSNNCTANTTLTVGSDGTALSTWSFDGYMRDVRIVNGTGLYSGTSITVPTEPLTAVTNTKFLLGDLPYFKDQSTSNHAITVSGNASLEPKSLFDNATYSEASHGASVYLDGTGDYISAEDDASFSFGTGDFTVECWLFHQNASALYYDLIGTASNANYIGANRGGWIFGYYHTHSSTYALKFGYQYNNAFVHDINFSKTLNADTWYHIALTRQGNQLKYFVDGIQVGSTVTNSTNIVSTEPLTIGTGATVTSQYVTGYMSDVRVVKGTAVYTSNFTPPTEPLTAITNTKFLLNPETSISDLSQSSAITCVADAATSTTQVKFAGTKSIYLDGTGDFLQSSESVNIAGDWTIEGWYYFTSLGSTDRSFFTIGDSASQTNSMEFLYRGGQAESSRMRFYNMGGGYSNQHTPPADFLANNWIHIAVVRSGTGTNNIKAYINGTQSGTGKTSNNDLIGKVNIGTELYNGAGSWFTQGYIQDFRVSSIARYTANFTPPTAELQG